jgi:hypothetical protein
MPEWSLSDIPDSVVSRAQEDTNFALQLLDPDRRNDALMDPDLGLSDEQQSELLPILDDVARMSFQEAIQKLRDEGTVSIT